MKLYIDLNKDESVIDMLMSKQSRHCSFLKLVK